ncbi:MAG: restriction endonuclease subunit S [Desulfamplus sp.]|nr:restriction endonuclease subunit S [Desulfamplus sp.]
MSEGQKARLGDLVTIIGGGTPSKKHDEYWNGNIPWASVKDISKAGKYLSSTIDTITESGLKNSASNLIEPGALIVPTRMLLGVAVINSIPLAINQDLKALRCSGKVDSRYLAYCINSRKDYFEREGSGATVKGITLDVLRSFEIPLPPLKEQRRIADILDKADSIRRKRLQAIKLSEDFLRSVFLDMFGDPVTNPKGWEVKPLDVLLTFLTSGSRGWAKYYSEDGALFLRIQNVGRNVIKLDDIAYVNAPKGAEAKRTKVEPGDVLLSITADLGRCCVVPNDIGNAYINQHLSILRIKRDIVEPIFLSAFIASAGGQTQIFKANKSAVKAGLNFSDIKSLNIMVPPLELQKKYQLAHQKNQLTHSALCSSSSTLLALFNSLSNEML